MCVAASGRVVALDGPDALVDFHGNQVTAKRGLVDVKVGDQVLVHAGCILQVLTEQEEAQITDLSDLFAQVGAY